MNPEGIMLSEISQTEKDKYFIYMWNVKQKVKLIDTENRLVVARGGGLQMKWVKVVKRYKLPVIK